jgi:hypothetical protein
MAAPSRDGNFPRKRKKDPIYKASDFDDPDRIKKYRENSDSQQKEDKDVAHYLSKELAAAIMNDYRDDKHRPQNEKKKLIYVLNRDENLRMVKREINQGKHRAIDRAIWEKAGSDPPELLNVEEAARAVQAAKTIHMYYDYLDKSTRKCFVDFFKDLKFPCSVWDYVEA